MKHGKFFSDIRGTVRSQHPRNLKTLFIFHTLHGHADRKDWTHKVEDNTVNLSTRKTRHRAGRQIGQDHRRKTTATTDELDRDELIR